MEFALKYALAAIFLVSSFASLGAANSNRATMNQMDKLKDQVDPKHQYSESERTMGAMAALWQWKLGHGDTVGAEESAAGMVAYYKMMFNRYESVTEACTKKGDTNGVCTAAVKAYEQVPDGQKLDVSKDAKGNIQTTVMGEDGKVVRHQVMSPDQVLKWVTGGGIQNFNQLIVAAGGQLAEAEKVRSSASLSPSPQKSQKTEKRSGTGFFVSDDGYLITNEHVVNSCEKLQAIDDTGQQFAIRIVRVSKSDDLALLRVRPETSRLITKFSEHEAD